MTLTSVFRNNLLLFLTLACILSFSFPTHAQKKSQNEISQTDYTPRFIEGIELRTGHDDVLINDTKDNGGTNTKKEPTTSYINVPKNIKYSKNPEQIETCKLLQFKYAQLMDVEVEEISSINLYNFIDEWWGTKYRYGGSTKNGIDCSSLSGLLHQSVYGNNLPRMAKDQYQVCEKVETDDMKEGDLVFFNTSGGVSHVGVYLNNRHFVHASTKQGVIISSLDEEYYSKRFIGAGRFVAKQ